MDCLRHVEAGCRSVEVQAGQVCGRTLFNRIENGDDLEATGIRNKQGNNREIYKEHQTRRKQMASETENKRVKVSGGTVLAGIIVTGLAVAATVLGFKPIGFQSDVWTKVGQVVAILGVVAVVIERAVEVYVSKRYDHRETTPESTDNSRKNEVDASGESVE